MERMGNQDCPEFLEIVEIMDLLVFQVNTIPIPLHKLK